MRRLGVVALVLAGWLAGTAGPAAAVAAATDAPRFSKTVTGTHRAVIRPAPGHATRLARGKPATPAARRAALRKRINALIAQAADLDRAVADATDPRAKAVLEVRRDACRQELAAARRAEALMRRREGGR